MMPLLRAFPEPSPEEAFSDRLLRLEGRPSPLLGGPVAFIVNGRGTHFDPTVVDAFVAVAHRLDNEAEARLEQQLFDVRYGTQTV